MQSRVISGDGWRTEEDFFEHRRYDPKIEKIEQRWSEGSSSVLLVKWGYIEREDWEKCFWLKHPSSARCHGCQYSGACPSYVFSQSNTEL